MCVGEQVHLSIMLLATLATSVGICDGAPLTVHYSFSIGLAHLLGITFSHIAAHFFTVRIEEEAITAQRL